MLASVEYISTQQWSNLFQVSPSQFNVTCQLQKEEFLQLSIINTCNHCIAWKLKTNRPGRYMVSPKQGIIPARQHKDCTVVLSKLKQVPDTKKPDKFLIQATKVNPQTQATHLPQLWKARESKHDKKRGVYAYQSLTIKCFLHIDTTKSTVKTIESKQNEKPNIIEDYVSSESNTNTNTNEHAHAQTIETKANDIIDNKQTNQIHEINEPITNNQTETQQNASNPSDIVSDTQAQEKQTTNETDSSPYNAQTVEQWRRKALEYDELFQFTKKTLAQRDELNVRWKKEEEKARSYMKLNRELKDEKKHILNEYNTYRNQQNEIDEMENKYDNDEEKKEMLNDEIKQDTIDTMMDDKIKREKHKNEIINEMNEIEQNAVRNSKPGFTMYILRIIITILLMYCAFVAGKYNTFGGKQIDNNNDDTVIQKQEI